MEAPVRSDKDKEIALLRLAVDLLREELREEKAKHVQ
jgi:hypothetical protein